MQILRVFVSFVFYILFLITRQQNWTRYLTSNGDSDPRAKLEPEYLARGRLFCRPGTSRSPLMACTGLPESLQCNIHLRAAKLTGDFPPFIRLCILYLTNIKKGEAGWMRNALFSCSTAKRKQYRFFVGCGFLRKK